jgi:hypothetical protein
MQGAVRGGKCHVGKERLVIRATLFDELDGLVRVGLRGIEVLRQLRDGAPVFRVRSFRHLPFDVPRVVEVASAADKQREITLEAAGVRDLVRFKAQVPFPGHVGVVAVVTQQRGDCDYTLVEYALVTRFSHLIRSVQFAHIAQASDMVVRSAEEHGPGNRARRRHVKVGIAHTLLRQLVQYRRVDLASVTSQVRIAQIIGNDQENIGPLVLC